MEFGDTQLRRLFEQKVELIFARQGKDQMKFGRNKSFLHPFSDADTLIRFNNSNGTNTPAVEKFDLIARDRTEHLEQVVLLVAVKFDSFSGLRDTIRKKSVTRHNTAPQSEFFQKKKAPEHQLVCKPISGA